MAEAVGTLVKAMQKRVYTVGFCWRGSGAGGGGHEAGEVAV